MGELVQWDTSEHAWLEDRGPRLYLIGMIDDASSRIHAQFVRHDSTEENMRLLWSYIERYGRPVSCYTDKASLFQTAVKVPRDLKVLPQDERDPDQRLAWLRAACEGDAQLYQQVEKLIHADCLVGRNSITISLAVLKSDAALANVDWPPLRQLRTHSGSRAWGIAVIFVAVSSLAGGDAPGWFKAGDHPMDYDMGSDTTVSLHGKSTGFIKNNRPNPGGFGTYM